MEQVDRNGVTYGANMMMNVLSAIPFAQSIFLYLTGLPLSAISSAHLVTDLHFGSNKNPDYFGLGTNVIGDVYLAFGLFGVILLFWSLGYVLRKLYYNIYNGNTLAILVYTYFFMSAIFYTRSGYLTPTRDIVWGLGVYWLSNLRYKRHE
jgi:oligosaccharide repeat unit polymerase